MFCGYCGSQMRDGANFCPACGAKMKLDDDREPVQDEMPQAMGEGEPAATYDSTPEPEEIPAAAPKMGVVFAVAGVVSGQGFRLPETNILVIGKDPKRSFWVIDDELISGEHCSIRYQSVTDQYLVTDLSRNGTFVENARLEKGVPTVFSAGTILSLADGTNQIRLG